MSGLTQQETKQTQQQSTPGINAEQQMSQPQGGKKPSGRRKMSLAAQIFTALILAIIAGLLLQSHADFTVNYIKPFGTIFLNLIKFIVGPIVLFSIMAGVISLSDIRRLGSIGGITLVYYFFTTAGATTIGLFLSNLFKAYFPVLSTSELTYEVQKTESGPLDVLVNMFPSNFLSSSSWRCSSVSQLFCLEIRQKMP